MLRQSVCSVRSISGSAARKQDLVQQAFVKRIREYGQKGGDLINSSPEIKKQLQDSLNRLANKFHLANADIVGKLPTQFETVKVESAAAQLLEGKSVDQLLAQIEKETSDYVAAREARLKEEAARAAAIQAK